MADKNEIWVPIENYEGIYEVSNIGRVKNSITNNQIKPTKNTGGYLRVGLHKNGVAKEYRVHRLVAKAFINNDNNYCEINHIDENKSNNTVENLEWCNRKHNLNSGTVQARIKKSNHKSYKKVFQLNNRGEKVGEFTGVREAERQTGFSNQHISECCRGKIKQAYGYIWRFEYCET